MRLFIAFEVTPEERTRLLCALDEAGLPRRLRKSDPEKWHLTLVFLGEVDPDQAEILRAGLRRYGDQLSSLPEAARRGCDPLHLERLGAFPGLSSARVLWIGPEAVPDSLLRIREEVLGLLEDCGFPVPEKDRPFRPHLTLARLKSPEDLRETLLSAVPAKNQPRVRLSLKRLHLMESVPRAGEQVYSTLETIDFSGLNPRKEPG